VGDPNLRQHFAVNQLGRVPGECGCVGAKCFGDLVKYVSLEEGVVKMAVWAKKTGARQGKLFAGIEVRKNLPSSWAALERSS